MITAVSPSATLTANRILHGYRSGIIRPASDANSLPMSENTERDSGENTERRSPDSSSEAPSNDDFRLLHVEDDEAFADLTAAYLSRLAPRIDHVSVPTVAAARDRFDRDEFEAIVCDHDLPDGTGLDFLRYVRTVDPDVPVILFTGKGSEEVASEAISAGVTDYLQKRGGSDQYEVLANRVHNAVDRYRLGRQVDRSLAALEAASEPIGILDGDGTYLFANQAYASVYGLRSANVVGMHWRGLYPDEEVERFTNTILPHLTENGYWTGDAVGRRADGTLIHERLALTHTSEGGHVCIIRDAESEGEQK